MSCRSLSLEETADIYRRQLRASRACFDAIVNRSADGVVVLSADGGICFVNPAAETLLGRPAEQLLGEIFGIPLVPGEAVEIDLLRDGSLGIAELRVVETEWQDRPAYLATLRDITEHKLAEQKAREAVRRRDEFLAMLSHELRNPLAAIVNAARIMRRGGIEQESFERSGEVIERQCQQMTRLLHDLLEVSRVSQGKIELRRTVIDLRSAVGEALEAVTPLIDSRSHRLRLELATAPLEVDGDPARLNQVVTNLLTNAAKYTDSVGTIRLTADREGGEAVLRVRDSGIGIPADMLTEVFEPFVQAHGSLSRSESGMGVGLALVRTLVELHGGTVSVQSDGPGRGSEFVVRLPLASVPSGEEPTAETAPSPGSQLRILVVEDNTDAREMLTQLLELDGHETGAAADGVTAVEMIELHRPQVALVDIGLPLQDGYEVARQVRANPANAGTLLIALTGYGQTEDRRRALEAGFDAHLVKPIELDELYRLLAECLSVS